MSNSSKSTNTKSALKVKATGGGDIKKDKHSIHIMFGCKRNNCTTCYMGLPYQMLVNMLGRK